MVVGAARAETMQGLPSTKSVPSGETRAMHLKDLPSDTLAAIIGNLDGRSAVSFYNQHLAVMLDPAGRIKLIERLKSEPLAAYLRAREQVRSGALRTGVAREELCAQSVLLQLYPAAHLENDAKATALVELFEDVGVVHDHQTQANLFNAALEMQGCDQKMIGSLASVLPELEYMYRYDMYDRLESIANGPDATAGLARQLGLFKNPSDAASRAQTLLEKCSEPQVCRELANFTLQDPTQFSQLRRRLLDVTNDPQTLVTLLHAAAKTENPHFAQVFSHVKSVCDDALVNATRCRYLDKLPSHSQQREFDDLLLQTLNEEAEHALIFFFKSQPTMQQRSKFMLLVQTIQHQSSLRSLLIMLRPSTSRDGVNMQREAFDDVFASIRHKATSHEVFRALIDMLDMVSSQRMREYSKLQEACPDYDNQIKLANFIHKLEFNERHDALRILRDSWTSPDMQAHLVSLLPRINFPVSAKLVEIRALALKVHSADTFLQLCRALPFSHSTANLTDSDKSQRAFRKVLSTLSERAVQFSTTPQYQEIATRLAQAAEFLPTIDQAAVLKHLSYGWYHFRATFPKLYEIVPETAEPSVNLETKEFLPPDPFALSVALRKLLTYGPAVQFTDVASYSQATINAFAELCDAHNLMPTTRLGNRLWRARADLRDRLPLAASRQREELSRLAIAFPSSLGRPSIVQRLRNRAMGSYFERKKNV